MFIKQKGKQLTLWCTEPLEIYQVFSYTLDPPQQSNLTAHLSVNLIINLSKWYTPNAYNN